MLFSSWKRLLPTGPWRRGVPWPTSRCQSILPVRRSKRMSSKRSSSWCAVTKMASCQIAGVELPHGILVFQTMFSVLLQWVGRLRAEVTLSPAGPRHCGQISTAESESLAPVTRNNASAKLCMEFPPRINRICVQNNKDNRVIPLNPNDVWHALSMDAKGVGSCRVQHAFGRLRACHPDSGDETDAERDFHASANGRSGEPVAPLNFNGMPPNANE